MTVLLPQHRHALRGAVSIFFEALAQDALFDKSRCLVNRLSAMFLDFDIQSKSMCIVRLKGKLLDEGNCPLLISFPLVGHDNPLEFKSTVVVS